MRSKMPTLHWELDNAVDEIKVRIYNVSGTIVRKA